MIEIMRTVRKKICSLTFSLSPVFHCRSALFGCGELFIALHWNVTRFAGGLKNYISHITLKVLMKTLERKRSQCFIRLLIQADSNLGENTNMLKNR